MPATREDRPCGAVQHGLQRVESPSGGRDEQLMFEALGECLTWVGALDKLLEDQNPNCKAQRDADANGKVLKGLRYARNQIVHGVTVVDLAGRADVPTVRVIIAGGGSRGGAQIIMPPTRLVWTFKPSLPQPTPAGQRGMEPEYTANVAAAEVMVPFGQRWPG